MNILKSEFGNISDQTVYAYTLVNDYGMKVTCINYGCIITDIQTPDLNGRHESVVLGFDHLEDYIKWSPYFGAVVGRVAGRIKNAKFELDGKAFSLTRNEGSSHLHGGLDGLHQKLWDSCTFEEKTAVGVVFSCISYDGEEGYPGKLLLKVEYRLTNENELIVTYHATSDKKTIVNLTNHTYFNLSGNLKNDIINHKLFLNSNRLVELDKQLLPTGNILNVRDTVFDFQHGRALIEGITSNHPQIKIAGNGYDHPFIFDKDGKAILTCEESGRKLTIMTDQPGMILYTSNQLDGDYFIRGTKPRKYLGVCLETQRLHQYDFPSIILGENEEYKAVTKYAFSVVK
ncbi:aldose 1-epimerase [Heyndrickxia sporothermodurans]|nr:aldose 1-epimerase [Heyndrickxia sporothermodurans]